MSNFARNHSLRSPASLAIGLGLPLQIDAVPSLLFRSDTLGIPRHALENQSIAVVRMIDKGNGEDLNRSSDTMPAGSKP